MTTSARMACGPSLVWTMTPAARPSSTTVDWNQLCRRSVTSASRTMSSAACLKPSGSKAAAKTMGWGLVLGVEVEHPPAGPLAPQRLGRADCRVTVGFRGVHAEPPGVHAVDDLHREAAHRDLRVVVHVVQHQHHAAGCEAPEVGIALDQHRRRPVARGGHRRRDAGRTAAHDDHAGGGDDRQVGLRAVSRFQGMTCVDLRASVQHRFAAGRGYPRSSGSDSHLRRRGNDGDGFRGDAAPGSHSREGGNPYGLVAAASGRPSTPSVRSENVAGLPFQDPPFDEGCGREERHRKARPQDHGGVQQRGAEVVGRLDDQRAEAVVGADPLADDGPDDAGGRRDLQRREQEGQGALQPNLPQDLPSRWPTAPASAPASAG